MDAGGRAASGAAVESNAGRFGLLPSRGIRTSLCIRAIAETRVWPAGTRVGTAGEQRYFLPALAS
jgi:hypothetical protein